MNAVDLDQAVSRLDAWRRGTEEPPRSGSRYKEWLHFAIQVGPLHILVNYSVMDVEVAKTIVAQPRVALLVRDGGWGGQIVQLDACQVEVRTGSTALRFGQSRCAFRNGRFHLRFQGAHHQLEATVRPLGPPTVTSSVRLSPGRSMHWVVIPRSVATGRVRLGGRWHAFRDAPTYHDHNWGQFGWGEDLAWEWASALFEDSEWSLVMVRTTDAHRHRVISQGLVLWRDDVNVRTFQNRELQVTLAGRGPAPGLTLPGPMGLLVPPETTAPRSMEVRAAGYGDHLSIAYDNADACRIAIPSDGDPLGVVQLNETVGPITASGAVGGQQLELSGSAVVEFVRG